MLLAATPALIQARRCWDTPKEAGVEACRQALSLGQPEAREALVRQALATKLAALERWSEVVDVYRDAAGRRPRDPEVLFGLGRALLHIAGQADEAEAALRESLRLRPQHAAAWVELGTALAAQKRYPEAVTAFDEAVRLEPEVLARRPAARSTLEAARRGEPWPAPPAAER